MDIKREGNLRREVIGVACENETPEIYFDEASGSVFLTVSNCDGMGAKGRYKYKIKLSVDDLGAIINRIAIQRSVFDEGPLRAKLKELSQSLLTLLLGSSGVPWVMPKRPDANEILKRLMGGSEKS